MKPTEADKSFLRSLPPDGSQSAVTSDTPESRSAQTRSVLNGWAVVDRSVWKFSITPLGLSALKEEA